MHIFILSPQQLSAGPGGTAIGNEKLFPFGIPPPGSIMMLLLFGSPVTFLIAGLLFLLSTGFGAVPQVAQPAIFPLSWPPPLPPPGPPSLHALSIVLIHVHSLPKFPPFN